MYATGAIIPAILKGEDFTGKTVGLCTVLGCSGQRSLPSGKRRAVWVLRCNQCNETFQTDPYSAVKKTSGCRKCQGIANSGQSSAHWRGGKHVPAYFLASIKVGSKRRSRDLEFSLTCEDLDSIWEAQQGVCVYTGWELNFGTCSTEQTASLDRIDSNLGYVPGNVQFVHKKINIMKWSLSEEEFLSLCRAVVKNVN